MEVIFCVLIGLVVVVGSSSDDIASDADANKNEMLMLLQVLFYVRFIVVVQFLSLSCAPIQIMAMWAFPFDCSSY